MAGRPSLSIMPPLFVKIKKALSYNDWCCHFQKMKKPQLIELEFVLLLAVVLGGIVYGLFRIMLALLA